MRLWVRQGHTDRVLPNGFRQAGDAKRAPYNLMLSEAATARLELRSRAGIAEFQKELLKQIRNALRAKRRKR